MSSPLYNLHIERRGDEISISPAAPYSPIDARRVKFKIQSSTMRCPKFRFDFDNVNTIDDHMSYTGRVHQSATRRSIALDDYSRLKVAH